MMPSSMLFFRSTATSLLGVGLFAGVFAFSGAAQAQGVDEFGAYGTPRSSASRQSAQQFALELRMGPYLPQVDDEFGGSTPYTPFTKYFGTKHRVAVGLELDWLPLVVEDVFRFGAGFGLMYTSFSGKAFKTGTYEESDQATSMRLLPHWAAGVLRVDVLDRKTVVPLVFAAKLGLAQALWWTKDEPRNTPAYDGTMGRGRSYGVYYGAGVYLDPGFLDVTSRKRMDAFLGVNRLYFFGEFYGMELNAFGAGGVMNLTDRSWVLGLAFDI